MEVCASIPIQYVRNKDKNQMQLVAIGHLYLFQIFHNISIRVESKDQRRHVSAVECEPVEMSHVRMVKLSPNLPMFVKALEGALVSWKSELIDNPISSGTVPNGYRSHGRRNETIH